MLKNVVKATFMLYVICIFTIADHGGTSQYANLIFVLFALVSSLYIIKDLRIKIEGIVPFIIFAAVAIVSLAWTPDKDIAMTRISTILLMVLLMFFIYNDFEPEDSGFIIKSMWIGGTVLCIWVFSYYGINGVINGLTQGIRMDSDIMGVNSLARDMAIYIVINIFIIAFYGKKLCILTLVMGIIILLFTQSRAALFGAIAGCIIIIFFVVKEKKKYIILVAAVTVALALFMNYFQSTELYESVFQRLLLFTSYLNGDRSGIYDASAEERFALIEDGLALFKKNPVFGYGIASCYSLTNNTYFHNNYVQLLVEVGIVGFLPFYFFHINKLKTAITNIRENVNYNYNVLAVGLLAEILIWDYANATYYAKPHFLIFALIMVLTKREEKIEFIIPK